MLACSWKAALARGVDSSDVISIAYLGVDSGGDALNINGLDYGLSGPNLNLVPELSRMTATTVALVGIAAARRRRQGQAFRP